MKRIRLILGIALICVIAASAFFVINYFSAVKPPVPTPMTVPTPPAVVGCYEYSPTAGWVSAACGVGKGYHTEGDGGTPGILGIASLPTATSPASSITMAEVDVKFSSFSGEFDSGSVNLPTTTITTTITPGNVHTETVPDYGGAFSIQLNTNLFPTNYLSNKIAWEQFFFGNACSPDCYAANAKAEGNGGCMEGFYGPSTSMDFNSPSATYPCTCYPGPNCTSGEPAADVLSSSYEAKVRGEVVPAAYAPSSMCSQYCLEITVIMGNGRTIGITWPDLLGLAGQWNQAVGTILGYIDGSVAVFYGPTVEWTDLLVTSCPQSSSSNPVWGCASTLNGEIFGYSQPPYQSPPNPAWATVESNTLTYNSVEPLNCAGGMCELVTESCFMGSGSGTQTTCYTAPIPGFPFEAIIIGLAVGVTLLVIRRRPSGFRSLRPIHGQST